MTTEVPALSISSTLIDVPPVETFDDLSVAADTLNEPIQSVSAVPVEIGEAVSVPVAVKAKSPILLWSLGSAASILVLSGFVWAVWSVRHDRVSEEPALSVAAKSKQSAIIDATTPQKPLESHVDQPRPKDEETAAAPSPIANKPAPLATETVATNPQPGSVAKSDKPSEPGPVNPSPTLTTVKAADTKEIASSKSIDSAPAEVDKVTAATSKVNESIAKVAGNSPVFKFDPLDFDLEHLGASDKPASDTQPQIPRSVPEQAPNESADNLASNKIAHADADVSPGPQIPAANAAPQVAVNGVFVRRGQPSNVSKQSPEQALAMRVKSFQVTDMPLVSFVEKMSDLAAIGITLDPIALEQVGISPQATVSVSAEDVPLQTILHEALTQRRLDLGQQGGWPRVVLPKANERHSIAYDVNDLVTGSDGHTMAELIERFVAPATWKSAGGEGVIRVDGTMLHIEQSDTIRRQIVIFSERLRLARGLAIQSKYPASLLSVEPPYQVLSERLGLNTTFTFLPWTRLADVIHNWQDLIGLLIFVDWNALAEAEFSPSSPVACSANNRPWEQVLDGVLEPLGLTWWAVDSGSIQITTPAALEKIERIEFYHVPHKMRTQFASNQAFIESLQKNLHDNAGKPLAVQMDVDVPSGRLIVLASPAAHRLLSKRLNDGAKQ